MNKSHRLGDIVFQPVKSADLPKPELNVIDANGEILRNGCYTLYLFTLFIFILYFKDAVPFHFCKSNYKMKTAHNAEKYKTRLLFFFSSKLELNQNSARQKPMSLSSPPPKKGWEQFSHLQSVQLLGKCKTQIASIPHWIFLLTALDYKFLIAACSFSFLSWKTLYIILELCEKWMTD